MEEILEQAGLTRNEAKVYLTLSKLGMTSAYRVAKESGIYKANVYDTLKTLEEKSLVSKQEVDNKTVYEASEPSFLLDIIRKKQERLLEVIPSIKVIQQQSMASEKSGFKAYKGVNAFISILFHFLEFKEPILVYGAPKKAYELLKDRIRNFHEERIKMKIPMKHIYNFEAIERINKIKRMPYTAARNLPQMFDSQVSTNICGDEVVFAIWIPPVKIIQIKDKNMADAYKKYFEILWKNAN